MDNSSRRQKTIPLLVGALSVFAGGIDLIGWAFDITTFKGLLPGGVSMTPDTALAFILAGLAVLTFSLPSSILSVRLAQLCALLCGLIGLLTLGGYFFTWNPGFDQWLLLEPPNTVGISHPSRMPSGTATCFVLLAAELWFARGTRNTIKIFLTTAFLGSLTIAIALTPLLSFCWNDIDAFGMWGMPRMSFPIVTLLILLSTTIAMTAWPQGVSLWLPRGRTAIGFVIWSFLLIASFAWSLHQQRNHLLRSVTVAARANINKDIGFRKWAASHGGVYVPPTEHTPPNPYLNVPDRDVVTTTGMNLTLMNPAFMLREMQQNFSDSYGTRSRITSLKPLNPANTPDAWQAKALSIFEQGGKELIEIQQLDGQLYLRLMQPFIVERDCLKCHVQQGYKQGDIIGGIDSSIPLISFLERTRESNITLALTHGAIWLLGISGLLFFYWREHYLNEKNGKLESQLHQAQKMEAIGTLAGGIAHDFNNILSIIFGYNELAMLEKNPVNRLHHLKELKKGAERAKELVAQILTFSRKTEQQQHPLQISLIIKEALKMLRSSIPTTIEFKQNIASDGLVLADPTQIHQIVMNLCTNAYHAMRETGGTLAVSLEEVKIGVEEYGCYAEITQGDYLKLEVSDTGCGIDPKTQEKIFEPYFTTKKPGEGTGLGLAVVHGIVKNHHGHITVYSEPWKGTSFHVYLPLTEQEVVARPDKTAPKELRGKGERLLFVDDERQIREVVNTILTGNGYHVTTFADGAQALAEFQKEPEQYDLVITDMTMPFMTGAELAQKILALRPQTPVIICTGQSELINKEKALALGICEYLNKPVLMETLLVAVRKALERGSSSLDHRQGA